MPTPPNQCQDYISISYTLPFLKYSPDKIIVTTAHPHQPHTQLDAMGENNTCMTLKGYGATIFQILSLCSYLFKERVTFMEK